MSLAFSAIIPAYNEEKTIVRAVRETRRVFVGLGQPYEIIVVDDGSRDKTSSVVKKLMREIPELRLVSHAKNQGKGSAVKTGAAEASGEIFLFLDSDLATQPAEFKAFLKHFDDYDIVIGSRRVKGARIAERQPLYRTWIGRAFNFAVRRYMGLPFHDTQCGFKAFKKKTKPLFASLRSRGWVFDVELLVQAQRRGYRIKEAPVTWRHGRESKVRLGHALGILQELRKIKNGK